VGEERPLDTPTDLMLSARARAHTHTHTQGFPGGICQDSGGCSIR